jgi:hypothetical protein
MLTRIIHERGARFHVILSLSKDLGAAVQRSFDKLRMTWMMRVGVTQAYMNNPGYRTPCLTRRTSGEVVSSAVLAVTRDATRQPVR